MPGYSLWQAHAVGEYPGTSNLSWDYVGPHSIDKNNLKVPLQHSIPSLSSSQIPITALTKDDLFLLYSNKHLGSN